MFFEIIIGVVAGGDVEVEFQVLYFFQVLPFFPDFDKYVGDDLFGGFFCFDEGFGELEKVGVQGSEQLFICLLIVESGDPGLQCLNGSSGNHLAKQKSTNMLNI